MIGHGGLYITMLPQVLANVDLATAEQLPFPNTGYVLAETRAEGLVCLEWCGTTIGQDAFSPPLLGTSSPFPGEGGRGVR